MLLDSALTLSGGYSAGGAIVGQSVTGSGNVLSTNVVDLGSVAFIDRGKLTPIFVQPLVDVVGGTSIEVQVITADDIGLSTNVAILGSSGAVPVATITANSRIVIEPKTEIRSTRGRYLGLRYVLTGAVTTASFLAAFVANAADTQSNRYFSIGYKIL